MTSNHLESEKQRAEVERRIYEGPHLDLQGERLPGAFRLMLPPALGNHIPRSSATDGSPQSARDPHLSARIRLHRGLHQCHYLEFDESDPLFQKQLGLLKEDTKALRKAFQREVDLAELPYWVSPCKRPESRREAQRLSILIRPFFTLDRSPHRPADRLRVRPYEWVCVLHVDADGLLHATRAIPFDSPGAYHFSQLLMSHRNEIDRLYGQWPALAQFMVTQLKAVHPLGSGAVRHSER